jgi:hypothetical protein
MEQGVFSVLHALNVAHPTSEEAMFITVVKQHGFPAAEFAAAKLHWRCQRPLQALFAMMNAHGRNYSVRRVKHKLPLGPSASSRKRS